MAVCDAYDAMTSVRPYRSPLTADEAIAELHRGRETQFEAQVVDLFVAALTEQREPDGPLLAQASVSATL